MNLGTTQYSKVAGQLRESILAGRWQPGESLPPERRLCRQFGLSRITIRQALQMLENERLVDCRHGSGTYVSPHPTRRIPLMIDYTGSMRMHASRLRRRVLLRRWQTANQEVAASLAIRPGEQFLYAERVDVLEDGQPVAWDEVYIPGPFAKGLEKKQLAHVDFLETWTKLCRFRIESCRQAVEAVGATAADNRNLGIPRGKAVLKSTENYCTQQDQRAGLFISYYHPDHICITSTFNWRTHQPAGDRPAT